MHLELRNIEKRFGPTVANRDISLGVESGTIHAVLGENGAGKSTLMKIISGFLAPDSGEVLIDGKPAPTGIATPLGRGRDRDAPSGSAGVPPDDDARQRPARVGPQQPDRRRPSWRKSPTGLGSPSARRQRRRG